VARPAGEDQTCQSTQMEQNHPAAGADPEPTDFVWEADILRNIQLLPRGEIGNTGFYVRGGGAEIRLVLLDEAWCTAPGIFNFFSVFNGDAIPQYHPYQRQYAGQPGTEAGCRRELWISA